MRGVGGTCCVAAPVAGIGGACRRPRRRGEDASGHRFARVLRYAYGRLTRTFAPGPTNFLGDVTVTTRLATRTAVFGLAYKFGAPVAGAIDVAMP